MTVKELADTPPWDWPRDARGTLMKTLRNRALPEDERAIAAELAGNTVVVNDDVAELLLSLVQDAKEPVAIRSKAAISLGPALEQTWIESGDEDDPLADPPLSRGVYDLAQSILKSVLDDPGQPKEVRRRALEAAVRGEADWHEDAIRLAYAQGDPEWNMTAVFAMGHLSGFENEIVQSLDSPDPRVRIEAVRAAGAREIDEAWPHIQGILSSKNADRGLLISAMYAAAAIRPSAAPDTLAEFLESGDEAIREAAEDALAEARPDLAEDDVEEDDLWR